MRKVEWESWNGHACVLEMEDGTDEEVTLTGGESPFITQMSDEADLFTPIRGQSGYVRIVGNVDDVAALVASAPLERPVRLTVDGEVAWKGFLSCETFTQPWDRGPIELELPVVSGIGLLGSVKPGSENLGYIKISAFLCELNEALGGMYEKFIFPTLSEPQTTLNYHFCMMNYASGGEKDEGGASKWGYEMSSYYDILEDLCKLFGWSAQERGDTLIFQVADVAGAYVEYDADGLRALAAGETAEAVTVDIDVASVEIWGADHHLDYMAGKKSVKAIGNINPYPTEIYSMNLAEEEVTSAYGQERENGGVSTWYYTKQYGDSDEIKTLDGEQGSNVRYESFLQQSDAYSGCCAVCERVLKVENRTGAVPTEDSGWVNRILFLLKGMDYGTTYLTFQPRLSYVASGLAGSRFFGIKMKVSRSSSYDEEWEALTGWLKMKVTVGGIPLYDSIVAIRDGNLNWSYRGAGIGLSGNGFNIGCPQWSGDIKVEFKVPDPLGLDMWEEKDFGYYYSIEEFSIEYVTDWTKNLVSEEKKENQAKKELGTGFTENYVSECGLTTYRQGQFGKGIVLGADTLATPPLTLYDNKTAEEALRDRLVNAYSSSRERLSVTVRSSGNLLSACGKYRMHHGGYEYICISQDVDWRSDEIRGRFMLTR